MLPNVLPCPAEAAFERQALAGSMERFWRREFDRPEVRIGIDKSDAINVTAMVAANFPHEANLGLLRRAGQAKRQEFVGREFVSRDDSSAVAAEHDSIRFFRKRFSRCIRAEQHDRNFFCNASASA